MSEPHLIVLFGATGDLAKRKLLPGILHLLGSGLVQDVRLIGVSRHEYDDATFQEFAEQAIREFSKRPIDETDLRNFVQTNGVRLGRRGARGAGQAGSRVRGRAAVVARRGTGPAPLPECPADRCAV